MHPTNFSFFSFFLCGVAAGGRKGVSVSRTEVKLWGERRRRGAKGGRGAARGRKYWRFEFISAFVLFYFILFR